MKSKIFFSNQIMAVAVFEANYPSGRKSFGPLYSRIYYAISRIILAYFFPITADCMLPSPRRFVSMFEKNQRVFLKVFAFPGVSLVFLLQDEP